MNLLNDSEDKRKFYKSLLKGNLMKEIVSVMLQQAGYIVLPYGYEITLSGLSRELKDIPKETSETASRIRASPDLLVYLPKKTVPGGYYEVGDLMLVEVKMRRTLRHSSNFILYERKKLANFENYKRFWSDSYLVVVIPLGNIFYAQKIEKLAIKATYNAKYEFQKIEEVFPQVKEIDLAYFKEKARKIMKIFLN